MSRDIETVRKIGASTSFVGEQMRMLSADQILANRLNTHNAIVNKDYKRLFQPRNPESKTGIANNDIALVLFSGGIDSTTVLWLAKSFYPHVIGVEYDYEDRPEIERKRVRDICRVADVDIYTIAYPQATINSPETSSLPTNVTLKESNVIYYILAGNLGIKLSRHMEESGANVTIVAGQILSDWLSLRDFDRDGLVSYVAQAAPRMYKILNLMLQQEYGEASILIETPLIYASKREVVQAAKDLGVPLEFTWSCPNSSVKECGLCPQCLEKIDAFTHNRIEIAHE